MRISATDWLFQHPEPSPPGLTWALLIWIVFCALGIGFSVPNLLSVGRDLRVASRTRGPLHMLAIGVLINAVISGTLFLLCLSLAADAAFTSPASPRPPAVAVGQVFLVVFFLLLLIGLVAMQVVTYVLRKLVTKTPPPAIIEADAQNLDITSWSLEAQLLFGWAEEEVIGRSVEMLIPDHLRAQHQAGVARWRASGQGSAFGRAMNVSAHSKSGIDLMVVLVLELRGAVVRARMWERTPID